MPGFWYESLAKTALIDLQTNSPGLIEDIPCNFVQKCVREG